MAEHSRAVIPGFYGALPDGTIKTFSRGGSDITGAVVANAISAELYENWTDVSGILLIDPDLVCDAPALDVITYDELHVLSSIGAKVFHEDAIAPARNSGIPINIKNTDDPSADGTYIVSDNEGISRDISCIGITGYRDFQDLTSTVAVVGCNKYHHERIVNIIKKANIQLHSMEYLPCKNSFVLVVDKKDFEKASVALYKELFK